MTTADTGHRQSALDPARSCIVEAPAGSGKTELLTQRILKLLSVVDEPEQIIAITFTRKAAAEMRLRVFETLQAARSDQAVAPHRQHSLELARSVLQRSEAPGWSLVELSERLQIQTIDSLNTLLARQLPVLTSGLAGVNLTDNAESLYRIAARRTTESLDDTGKLGDALKHLLETADNSLRRLEEWLADILQKRDRWLRLLTSSGDERIADALQQRLGQLTRSEELSLRELAGDTNAERLFALLRQIDGDKSQTGEPASWHQAAALLLTANGDWRQRFTRREGFPPDALERRQELDELREQFAATTGLREALERFGRLPATTLSDGQTHSFAALVPVLNRLLAELRVTFAEHRTVDHTELALGALQALGAVDAPSDLLLALDRRIEHILVDEFQDTSHLQWEMLSRLTAGWEQGDGRSLFLVGDPMQSIYRFRDADLSLFNRAREQGIGEVRLTHLRLSTNWRSAPELVEQINSCFEQIAQTHFSPAVAGNDADPAAAFETHFLKQGDRTAENRRVVEIAKRELRGEPARSIGILVRSRNHLLGLRQALAEAGLAAHAVEVDSLADTQLGQDLLAFTAAMLHPADRLAWLGVLRSPPCGIGWSDLELLCAGDRDRTVPELLADSKVLAELSEQGRTRAQRLMRLLPRMYSLRNDCDLGHWMRKAWQLLQGRTDSGAQVETDNYFRQLNALARHGDLDDPAQLQSLFSKPDSLATPGATGIEVKTIHRAKGLEFDTVILPGLSRSSRGNSANLLFINDIDLPSGEHLNLAAVHQEPADPLMTYLQWRDREQEAGERSRLLYVAMTRARNRLHLIASIDTARPRPRSGSLLEVLWPVLPEPPGSTDATISEADPAPPEFVEIPLTRIALSAAESATDAAATTDQVADSIRPEFEWVNPASVQVGTVIHRELHRLACNAAAAGEPVPPVIETSRYRRELALLGVESTDLKDAAQRVAEALQRVWDDPTGRWLLEPHSEGWSEQRLTVQNKGSLAHIRLDRSFVDADGTRWIIDYKSGRHLGGNIDAFIESEFERYQDQLETYAAAVAAFDSRPIRVALYFPLMARFRDWTPTLANQRVPD